MEHAWFHVFSLFFKMTRKEIIMFSPFSAHQAEFKKALSMNQMVEKIKVYHPILN